MAAEFRQIGIALLAYRVRPIEQAFRPQRKCSHPRSSSAAAMALH
jgi:hypothetical protein